MAAISFDEAWSGNLLTTTIQYPSQVSIDSEHEVTSANKKMQSAKYSALESREHRHKNKHYKRKVKFVEPLLDTDSSDSGSESESEAGTCEMKSILSQLKELREENLAQSTINWTITYTSVAVIVILLVLVFHTNQKLHYTTDVLLWYLKTSHGARL